MIWVVGLVVIICISCVWIWYDIRSGIRSVRRNLGVGPIYINGPKEINSETVEEANQKLLALDCSVCPCCHRHIWLAECIIDYSTKHKRMTDHYLFKCRCSQPWVVVYPDLHKPIQVNQGAT